MTKTLTYNQARETAERAVREPLNVQLADRRAALARLIDEAVRDDNTRDEMQKILKLARSLVYMAGSMHPLDHDMAVDFHTAWAESNQAPATINQEPR